MIVLNRTIEIVKNIMYHIRCNEIYRKGTVFENKHKDFSYVKGNISLKDANKILTKIKLEFDKKYMPIITFGEPDNLYKYKLTNSFVIELLSIIKTSEKYDLTNIYYSSLLTVDFHVKNKLYNEYFTETESYNSIIFVLHYITMKMFLKNKRLFK